MNALISVGEQSGEVLLATALANIPSTKGKIHTFRALLDQASQATFITESAVQMLGLRQTPATRTVSGIGKAEVPSPRGTVHFNAFSTTNPPFKVAVLALVMPTVTHYHPNQAVKSFVKDIQLAAPTYGTPGAIDIILSADIVAQIMVDGLRRGISASPLAQNSKFGWVLFSRVTIDHSQPQVSCFHITVPVIKKRSTSFARTFKILH